MNPVFEIHKQIRKDKQIWKFCFYGLLKNLKFFEPYLLIYLIDMGMSLFDIGLLYAIREVVVYLFEVPSGIIADAYGKKRELMLCFTFYIISFIIFFFSGTLLMLAGAMIFFGLGEAFRSGTHKAMILTYLEQKGWFNHKTFVYGRTRSFSLIGSSISAFVSIVFVLSLPELRWLFLVCILPYILDFILIASYPDSLDERMESTVSMKGFFITGVDKLKSIRGNAVLCRVLLSSSLYDSIFKSIKDYIQPIMVSMVLTAGAVSLGQFSQEDRVNVYLGIIYGVFYIFSSIASKNVYRLNNLATSGTLMSVFFDIMGVTALILYLAITSSLTTLVVIIFFILYVAKDARRPLFLDVCADNMNKDERATAMSVDSMFTAVFMVILAPLFGYVADQFSIATLFLLIGILILVLNRFLNLSSSEYIDYPNDYGV